MGYTCLFSVLGGLTGATMVSCCLSKNKVLKAIGITLYCVVMVFCLGTIGYLISHAPIFN